MEEYTTTILLVSSIKHSDAKEEQNENKNANTLNSSYTKKQQIALYKVNAP